LALEEDAMTVVRRVLCLAIVAMGISLADAHTSAVSTTPKSGSVLDASPASITLTLKEAARLTSVVVRSEGKPERKLTFTPNTSATQFTIEDPKLEAGKSEVKWTALSKDGHVVAGTIVLTVKSAADAH
jgi:copper transport protein